MTKKINYLVSILIICTLVCSGALIYFFATKKDETTTDKYYTVTFYGAGLENLQVLEGSEINEPDAVKSGYKIEYWYKDAEFNTRWNFDTDKVNGNTVLYPKWVEDYSGIVLTKNNVKVSYNKGDENISTLGLTVWLERSDGYRRIITEYEVIDGRAEEGNKAGIYNVTIKYGDFTNSYKIRVLPSENEFLVEAYVNDSVYFSKYLLKNYSLELTEPNLDGYEFIGWYYTPDFTSGEEAVVPAIVTDNLKVYAKMLKKLNVTFANSEIETLDKLYGDTLDLSESGFELTEDNRNFIGWSKSNSAIWKSVIATVMSEEPYAYYLSILEEKVINDNTTGYYNGSRLVYKKEIKGSNTIWTVYEETVISAPEDLSGLRAEIIDDSTATIIGYYDGEDLVYKKYMGAKETTMILQSNLTLYPMFYEKQTVVKFLYEDETEPFETKIIGFGNKVGKLPIPAKNPDKGFIGYYWNGTLITEDYIFNYTNDDIKLIAKYEDEELLDASLKSPISKYTNGANFIYNSYYFAKLNGLVAEFFAYNIFADIIISADTFEFDRIQFSTYDNKISENASATPLQEVNALFKYISLNDGKTYYFKIAGTRILVFEEVPDAVVSIENGLVYVTIYGKLVRGTQLQDSRNVNLFIIANMLAYIDLSGYRSYGLHNEEGQSLTKEEFVWDNININLYMKYNKEVTISYNANGGSIVEKNFVGYEGVPFGSLSTPTRAGYVFEGWYLNLTDANKINSGTIIPAGIKTIYAKWIKSVEVEIKFYTTSYTTAFATQVYYKDQQYLALPAVNIEYYQFEGWFLDKDFTKPVTINSIVDGSTKLYAKLTAYTFTARINYGITGIGYGEMQFTIGSAISGLPAINSFNYSFGGWYTSESFSTSSYIYNGLKVTSVFENIYLKAIPISSVYIAFEKDASSVIEIRDIEGTSFKLPAQTQTKTGYTAIGYFEDLNGNGTFDSDTEQLYTKGTTLQIQDSDRYFYYLLVRVVKINYENPNATSKGSANLVSENSESFNEIYGNEYDSHENLFGSDSVFTINGYYIDFNSNGKKDAGEPVLVLDSGSNEFIATFEGIWKAYLIEGAGGYNVSLLELGLNGAFSYDNYDYIWNGVTKLYVYREGQLLSEITNVNARFEHNGKTFKLPYNLSLKPVYTENVSNITFYDTFEGIIILKSTKYWNSTIDAINVTESQINYYKDNQIFSGWFADENLNGVYDDGEMVYAIGESIVFTDKDINLYPYYSNYLYVTYIDENNISNGIKVIDNNNLYYLPDVSDSGFWYLDSNNNSEYDSGEVEITDVNYEDSNKYYSFNYDKINAIFIYDSNNDLINIYSFNSLNEFNYLDFTYRISGLDGENFYVIDVYESGQYVQTVTAHTGAFNHNNYVFYLPSYIRCARL